MAYSEHLQLIAEARRDWWSGVDQTPGHDVEYLQWVTDANTIELTKVTAIAGADQDRTEALTTAGVAHALAMSEAVETLDLDTSGAHHMYATALTSAGQIRGLARAEADRDFRIARAQAVRDLAVNEDQEAYDSAMATAAADRSAAISAAEWYEQWRDDFRPRRYMSAGDGRQILNQGP